MDTERRQFFETFVELSAEGDVGAVSRFFENAGLNVMQAKTGLFVSGGAKEFESATGVDPNSILPEDKLPIPESMRHAIRSINIVPVPDYFDGG